MGRLLPGVVRLMVAAALLGLAACTHTPPTNFYVLTPLPSTEAASQGLAASDGPTVGLGPVSLPSYLDRPQMVTRASPTKLDLAQFDSWAAPLQDSVVRVLAENLALLIPTDRVLSAPWPRSAPLDYQLTIDLLRFDGDLGGEAVLVARWRILDKEGNERLMKRSRYQAASGAPDYEAMANALSRTLESLSREIATALNLTRGRSPR